MNGGHLRSSSTSKAGKSPYNHCSVGATLTPNQKSNLINNSKDMYKIIKLLDINIIISNILTRLLLFLWCIARRHYLSFICLLVSCYQVYSLNISTANATNIDFFKIITHNILSIHIYDNILYVDYKIIRSAKITKTLIFRRRGQWLLYLEFQSPLLGYYSNVRWSNRKAMHF